MQLPGVESAVDLFGIRRPTADEAIAIQLADYGRALEFFERGEYEQAAEMLKNVTSAAGSIPLEFLREKIGKAIDLSKHRRRTDEASVGPVIALNVK